METKTARVFTSSPFGDMARERDILVRLVMPHLRDLCARHRMALIDVDLRWGTPTDPAAERNILNVIGPELNRASILMALLGDRFGQIPAGEYDSLTALELYRAIASPSINLVVFRRASEFTAQLAQDAPDVYLERDEASALEQKKLIRRLEWLGVDVVPYGTFDEFAEKAATRMGTLLEALYFRQRAAVFVSYSRHDSLDQTDRIKAILEGLRFAVWLDREGIGMGDEWPESIATAILECDVVLMLISPASVNSAFCIKEILFAIKSRKPILALHLQPVTLPDKIALMLGDVQHISLDDFPSIESAVATVSDALDKQARRTA